MASIVLDTKEFQQRLLVWGAEANGLIDDNGKPNGILNQKTIAAARAVGFKLGFALEKLGFASVGFGKTSVTPSELVTKLLSAPPVGSREVLSVQNVSESDIQTASKFPQDTDGSNIVNVAKRVAANVIRASEYAQQIAELSKQGKATDDLREAYRLWYRAATLLQQTLAYRLQRNPRELAKFKEQVEKQGVAVETMIQALTKSPLAVVAATKSPGVSGFELWPFVITVIAGIAGLTLWNGPDILKAYALVKQENTTRQLIEAQIACAKAPGTCDQEALRKALEHQRDMQPISGNIWPWILGGSAAAGLGWYLLRRRG